MLRDTRALPLVKLLRLMAELVRAVLILWLHYPRLDRTQQLDQVQRWAQRVLLILNIEIQCNGSPPATCAGLVVANHLSWLDILVLQSLLPGVFVAKAEVQRWPLIGWMAQACATIFVKRSSPRSTRAMVEHTVAALEQGYSVVGFPQGTSADGSDLALFHANLFEGAIKAGAPVQPVTLRYLDAQTGLPADAALFIDNMTLLGSLRNVMATSSIRTQVHIGACMPSQGHTRKSLAKQAHQRIRGQLLTQVR